VLVTVETSCGFVDLELTDDTLVSEYLPLLLQHRALFPASEAREPFRFALGTKRGQRFDPNKSLAECDVVDGSVLLLQSYEEWETMIVETQEESLQLPHDQRSLLVIKQGLPNALSNLFQKLKGK
jgi:hypothetical protein